ncbi:MAG: YkgJ family cysteine cluster protein [Chitinispirillales bacterium]|jgi:Fe-S-cluster containining protein|nr:YkgJ family cysteine cluster protein [Chitinispirillales bacterium]
MDQLQTVVGNYYKLCGFCDQLWSRVRQAYPNEITCKKGCGICCELKSVSQIEAHVISLYLQENNGGSNKKTVPETAEKCPFLCEDACLIYNARPLICRTHGLVLRSAEFHQTHAASCPYNFPSFGPNELSDEFTLDIDMITKNLMRLNLAYCMCKGIQDDARNRVLLVDLLITRLINSIK